MSSRNSQAVCRIAGVGGMVSPASQIIVYAGTPSQPAPPLGDGGPATQGHLYVSRVAAL